MHDLRGFIIIEVGRNIQTEQWFGPSQCVRRAKVIGGWCRLGETWSHLCELLDGRNVTEAQGFGILNIGCDEVREPRIPFDLAHTSNHNFRGAASHHSKLICINPTRSLDTNAQFSGAETMDAPIPTYVSQRNDRSCTPSVLVRNKPSDTREDLQWQPVHWLQ